MSVLFGPRRFDSRHSFIEDVYDTESVLKESWKDQKTFLQQFSSQELFQIHKSALFIQSTANWAVTAEGNGLRGTQYTCWSCNISYGFPSVDNDTRSDGWDGVFLFVGPPAVLRCYEEKTTDHLMTGHLDDDGPYTKFLVHAFSEIIQERQVDEPMGCVGTILDDIHGEYDRCMTVRFLHHIPF